MKKFSKGGIVPGGSFSPLTKEDIISESIIKMQKENITRLKEMTKQPYKGDVTCIILLRNA